MHHRHAFLTLLTALFILTKLRRVRRVDGGEPNVKPWPGKYKAARGCDGRTREVERVEGSDGRVAAMVGRGGRGRQVEEEARGKMVTTDSCQKEGSGPFDAHRSIYGASTNVRRIQRSERGWHTCFSDCQMGIGYC